MIIFLITAPWHQESTRMLLVTVLSLMSAVASTGIKVCISNTAYGTMLGWTAPTIPLLQKKDNPIGGDPITTEQASWIGSIKYISVIAGLSLFSYISTKAGRKLLGYLQGSVLAVSWLIIAFTNSVNMICASQFTAGLGLGGLYIFQSLYRTEISDDKMRGKFGATAVFSSCFGALLIYILGSYASYYATAWTCFIISVIFVVAFYFAPESPQYLATIGKFDEAEAVLRWLRGKESSAVADEISKMKNRYQKGSNVSKKFELKGLFRTKGNIKALTIASFVCCASQLAGLHAVVSYTVNIFMDAGTSISPYTAAIIVGLLRIVGSLISGSLLDKLGRRVLLITANIVCAFCLITIGVYFYLKMLSDISAVSWLTVVCISMFFVAHSISQTSVLLLRAEVFSMDVRLSGVTLTAYLTWICAFLVTKMFLPLSLSLGSHWCFWIFASACIGSVIFTYFVIPETKNRSIESIVRELNGEGNSKITAT